MWHFHIIIEYCLKHDTCYFLTFETRISVKDDCEQLCGGVSENKFHKFANRPGNVLSCSCKEHDYEREFRKLDFRFFPQFHKVFPQKSNLPHANLLTLPLFAGNFAKFLSSAVDQVKVAALWIQNLNEPKDFCSKGCETYGVKWTNQYSYNSQGPSTCFCRPEYFFEEEVKKILYCFNFYPVFQRFFKLYKLFSNVCNWVTCIDRKIQTIIFCKNQNVEIHTLGAISCHMF